MKTKNPENNLIGLGVLTAISASLCCITPLLAILAGSSSLASTFAWLDPLRPYFIGGTILILGLAWFQKLKPKKEIDCCDTAKKAPFIQTKKFLILVTLFAGLMLTFPMYAHIFYPKTEKDFVEIEKRNLKIVEFSISGMTCTACEEHINHEVNQLSGIKQSIVSYENENAIIEFDKTRTSTEEIENAITKAGYSVIGEDVNK